MSGDDPGCESADMTRIPPFIRFSALAAPVLLFLYGVFRLVDGLDGDHGPGLAWNAGHTLFFGAFVLLGVLIVGLLALVPAKTGWTRVLASAATIAGLFGAGCFLWVIAGDLSAAFHDAAPLPETLELVGPLSFQLGMLTLLVMLATVRPRRLPVWSPVLVFAGFTVVGANLDLIPLGALLVLAGLAPLARDRQVAPR